MPKALYPGTFDPITYGHLDVIKRAEKIFDDLIVGIAANPRKEVLFSTEEREELVEMAIEEVEIEVSKVISFSGLLVNCAKKHNRESIVRGLRANSDFENEFQMALTNRDLAPSIESVFLMTAGEYSFLSSSIVKEVKELGGDVSTFVPAIVEERLEKKFM